MGAPLVGAVVYSAIPTRSPSSRSRCLMVVLVRSAPARHALRRRAVLSSFVAIVAASLEQDDEAAVLLTAAATLFKFLQQPSRRFVLRPLEDAHARWGPAWHLARTSCRSPSVARFS